MSKTPPAAQPASATPAGHPTWVRTLRETIESVVIAFILAFLFRTFEAEAFVIPTGSMAPTLQGRHKDIECPKCGYEYRVSASAEVDDRTGRLDPKCRLANATCPMCSYTLNVDPGNPENLSEYPSYNGDRIIVNKFAYDVSDPERWDVVVFKYPEDAKTNYIKRLVGLPNERLRVLDGDVYTAKPGSDDFQIARKPPKKLVAMLQPVYDNDFALSELASAGIPPRWQPWTAPGEASPWKPSEDLKSFQVESKGDELVWLRYQHLVPRYETWEQIEADNQPAPVPPHLITDFYAYNDGQLLRECRRGLPRDGVHWVGDLAVECELDVKTAAGAVTFELVKGGRQFRCRIDLTTGEAKLSIPGLDDFNPTAATSVRAPGTYEVRFANVDMQLILWIDGDPVTFDKPTDYPYLHNTRAVESRPVPGATRATDLSPVGVAVEGNTTLGVSHLAIWRDIYYIADPSQGGAFAEAPDRSRVVDLAEDQFFMLGDNSPYSKDSRYWSGENYVDRRLLIGKALWVYWPHSFDYVEIGDWKMPLPYWPNFGRMRFVR